MSIVGNSYPQPVEDADNSAYLNGWKNGRLLLQHCHRCGSKVFYPRSMCPQCWSDSLEWVESAGQGIVVSYSLIHRPNHPAFAQEVPITLAEIMLDDGVAILARVLSDEVQSGMRVKLARDHESVERYPLPIFRAAENVSAR